MKEKTVVLFSQLLLELYHLASYIPSDQFQEKALDAVRAVLPFDFSIWVMGRTVGGLPIPHALYSYGNAPEFYAEYDRIKHLDIVGPKLFLSPGKTLNISPFSSPWKEQFHPEMLKLSLRFRTTYTLATLLRDTGSKLLIAISMSRSDADQPFTEAERQLKQMLMPHLIEAWWINRYRTLHVKQLQLGNPSAGIALCDSLGWLHNVGENFLELMRIEWPDWEGKKLPDPLRHCFSIQEWHWESGNSIVITSESVGNLWMITVRKKTALDKISKRELEVARCFGQGMRYREIADMLHIATSTVSNHLRIIYQKLGIRKKTDLAALLNEVKRIKK